MDEEKESENICPASFLKLTKSNDTVLDTLRKYLTPDQNDKKMFGEVFTPLELICEMLSKLPKSVWKNKDLVWLDPANGIGNFPVIVYYKLMASLKDIKNDSERSKHIIENMLYMVELNPVNVALCKKIFKILDPDATPNIIKGSFLDENTLSKLPEQIDIIIGNPPYQAIQFSKEKRGGGDMLWDKFVKISIKILVSNGYLCFVHPAAWRKPESEHSKNSGLFELMTRKNQLLYLEIHDTKDGQLVFNSGTRYDFYVLQKIITSSTITIVKGDDGSKEELNLLKWQFLPNSKFKLIEPLLKEEKDGCDIIFSRSAYGSDKEWVQETKTSTFKYPLIHSTPKNGVRYMYSSRNDKGMFDVSKIIFGESGIYNSIIDIDGKYGMTQGTMAIPISSEKEGKQIKQVIESDEFRNILDACSWGNFRIDWRLFTYFKKDFYKYISGPFHYNGKDISYKTEGKYKKSKRKNSKQSNSKSKKELKSREKFRRSMCKK